MDIVDVDINKVLISEDFVMRKLEKKKKGKKGFQVFIG